MIETCSFFEHIKDTKDINENDNSKDNNKNNNNNNDKDNRGISALEHDIDLGFWEDIKDTNNKDNNYNNEDDNKDDNNNKDNNNNKGISAQGFDRTLEFSRRQLLSFGK